MYKIYAGNIADIPGLPPINYFLVNARGVLLKGVRISIKFIFEFSKYIFGARCLYFRISEKGVYVGCSKDPYGRHKVHLQKEGPNGRGDVTEIIIVWDERGLLSEEEFKSLEAAYIQHFPRNAQKISRTNDNTMQIVYGEHVRDNHLLDAYMSVRRIIVKLELMSDEISQIFRWHDINFTDPGHASPSHLKYLTDVTHNPDTVVVYGSTDKLAALALDRRLLAVKIPNIHHRRSRFIAICEPVSKSVICFAEIKSKREVGNDKYSITYDLEFMTYPFKIRPVKISGRNSVTAARQSYVLLANMLAGASI